MASAPLLPMLASSGRSVIGSDRAVEAKLDGWRCILLTNGDIRAWSRRGREISDAVPQLARIVDALPGRRVILDGELVFGAGRPDDFYRFGPALARRPSRSISLVAFVAFDVLFDGEQLTKLCYHERRRILEDLRLSGPGWQTAPSFRVPPVDLLASCNELGLEGVIVKRLDSVYRPGVRSRDWLKFKTDSWRAAARAPSSRVPSLMRTA
jgi:bifunctional non-homologous end joining protein LigD